MALLHTIREAQSALASIVSPELGSNPRVESLERFLARLPDRWLEEQEHTGQKPRVRPPRTWRTRKDPFEGVWCKVLGWSQEDPDASAVSLLERLRAAEPDRFSRAHLRTLQRRVQQWRASWPASWSTRGLVELRGTPATCRNWRYRWTISRADFSVTFLDEATGPARLIVVDQP